MYFKNIEFLYLILLVLPFIYLLKNKSDGLETIFSKDVLEKIKLSSSGISKKIRAIFLIIAYIFVVIALSRPYINNGEIKVKSSFVNIVSGIDISKSMFVDDIYPNRFKFAKKKFIDMLKYLKNTKVALIGFSSQTFLVSPLTEDFYTLKFLTKNLNMGSISLRGTDILNTLKTANELFKGEDKKVLVLFTDGGDKKDFSQELDYAKEHNIIIYVYNIGTKKGGVIKTQNGVLKDKSGNIVIVRLNESIKNLALKSGGAYMKYSLNESDIKVFAQDILNRFKAKDEQTTTIKDTKELFYVPLVLAFIFVMISFFSFPKKIGGVNLFAQSIKSKI